MMIKLINPGPIVGNQTYEEYLRMFGYTEDEIQNKIDMYYELPRPTFNIITELVKNKSKEILDEQIQQR